MSADFAGRVTWNDARAIASAVALVPDHDVRARAAATQDELERSRLFCDAFSAALEAPFEPGELPAFPEMPPIDGARLFPLLCPACAFVYFCCCLSKRE